MSSCASRHRLSRHLKRYCLLCWLPGTRLGAKCPPDVRCVRVAANSCQNEQQWPFQTLCKKANNANPSALSYSQHRSLQMAAMLAFRGMSQHGLQAARGLCTNMWLSDPSCLAVWPECAQQGAAASVRQPWTAKVISNRRQRLSLAAVPMNCMCRWYPSLCGQACCGHARHAQCLNLCPT